MTSTPASVLSHIESNRDRFVGELKTFLRFPTVSTQTPHADDIRACSEWLAAHFIELGFNAEILPTARHPVVLASRERKPGLPTILVYGHYDVQPAEPFNLWESPPFEPTVKGGNLVARGATDDKGQVFTHIKAAEAWLRATGDLPVNLVFLIEGEEEIGSPNLETFIRQHLDRLKADYVVISDSSQFAPGIPAITYGLRGISCYGLTLRAAKSDLHSGAFGGAVPNPLHVAAELLSGIHDGDGRVTIPGFYDDVKPLEEWEREQWRGLPHDDARYRTGLGLNALYGEKGFSTLERVWGRPTFEINGIGGGYFGEGFKTVLPAQAVIKFSMRLVPNQDPAKLDTLVRDYLARHIPETVTWTLEPEHAGKPALVRTDSPGMEAAKRAVEAGFGTRPVLIREGGSIPIVNTFSELLGVDSLLLGWGQHDDNAHAPNEKFSLADFQSGIRSSAALFGELANLAK